MLLEVADSSITYRSRYFTTMQPALVLDLLMNDDANPRSLAFQFKDLWKHCHRMGGLASVSEWPVTHQARLEEAAAHLLREDVVALCTPDPEGNRSTLDHLLAAPAAALPDFSDAITHTYFSHAELGRAN